MAPSATVAVNGHDNAAPAGRFAHVPRAIDVPVSGGSTEEAVEIDLEDLIEDPTELCTLLENENVAKGYWTTIALAYAKQDKLDLAIEIVNRGLATHDRGGPQEKLNLFNTLCWFYLLKSRKAPRVRQGKYKSFKLPDHRVLTAYDVESNPDPEQKTKEHYLRAATTVLNDASRINPAFPPTFLARGVLMLLRAALQQDPNTKIDQLRQANRAFDDAIRASAGKNMLAFLGRSRTQFSMGKVAEALHGYQHVLRHAPDMVDPDPRIGIGCCFWQLGYREEAKTSWARALEINPLSKIANILMGLYYLNSSSQHATTDAEFAPLYKQAMVNYTQRAFKLDSDLPLACATFGSYFLVRKNMQTVETLARKAIELTDVSAIASDGWFLLARKEHYGEDPAKAGDSYTKADQARGGDQGGYLPAKFGAAQLQVLRGDNDGAKFRLERILQQNKSVEVMALLGTLFAEDAFSTTSGFTAEEQNTAARKATHLLESVRSAWKDPKRKIAPDSAVLLTLARLYELEHPDRSLQCLQQVEQMELDELPEELKPETEDDMTAAREHLAPQLLNNLACFHYQAERLGQAQELFQAALNACVKLGDEDETTDTDALVTTISYNLGRTYEAQTLWDDAKKIYSGLLERHSDYTDAQVRLTYIALRQNPADEGPKAVSKLYEAESTNMEVRALYGWYLRKAKRRTNNLNEDQEQRLYKHTLQSHDKHDRYALTAMGNLYLSFAREMPRNSESEKQKRAKMYERAVEFFDKAIQLDPRNAYAAQGIAIACIEDKKDYGTALQILSKVRDTVKDASVYINLGHVYCEVRQFSKAIESYDTALAKDRANDPQILACLGRAWLLRGKQEKNALAMRTSLEFSQRALECAPDQIHFQFNVAFVQFSLAQLMHTLPDAQRTLEDVEAAAAGLDAAIDSLAAISKAPNPPFPRHDIEQRANMGRNTMRKQLERACQNQREYEQRNADRLEAARQAREQEMARRAEQKRLVEAAAAEHRAKVAEERRLLQEHDRELAERRAEQERARLEELSVDEEGNEKPKKTRARRGEGGKRSGGEKKRKKQKDDEGIVSDDDDDNASDLFGSGAASDQEDSPGLSDADGAGAAPARERREKKEKPPKKKRRLERKIKEPANKYKSEEMVVDSDDEDDAAASAANGNGGGEAMDEDDEVAAPAQQRKKRAVVEDDDDEDDDGDAPAASTALGGDSDDE